MTFLDRLNSPKLDFTSNQSGDKIIKYQQSQALTSHFESFWSIVQYDFLTARNLFIMYVHHMRSDTTVILELGPTFIATIKFSIRMRQNVFVQLSPRHEPFTTNGTNFPSVIFVNAFHVAFE